MFAIHNRVIRQGDGASAPLILTNAYPVDGRMWLSLIHI